MLSGHGPSQQDYECVEMPSADFQKYRTWCAGAGGLIGQVGARTNDICVRADGVPSESVTVRTEEPDSRHILSARFLELPSIY